MLQIGLKMGAGAALLVLLLWAGADWLKPLGSLIPKTKAMLTTTQEILHETRGLQAEVERVHSSLAQVQQQERLLAEQQALMGGLLEEMKQQEQLTTEATHLMRSILEAERTTAALTAKADHAGAATMATVNASVAELDQLAAAARRIKGGSRTVDGQMDRLLAELQHSSVNFAVVARTRQAVGQVADQSTNWWDKVKEFFTWRR